MLSSLTQIPLEEGFHNGLEILFPPRDDDWWKGNFTHFNFNAIFNQIAKSAPPTMADESFENKWIINSSHRNEPVEWNEWELTFFSDFFVGFLELGKDPRDSPLDYFRWRCTKMDGSDEDEESIYQDLDMILGDKFDKKKWKTFMKQGFDVDQFIKQIVKDPLREDPEGTANSFLNPKLLVLNLTFQPILKLIGFPTVQRKFSKPTANTMGVWNCQRPWRCLLESVALGQRSWLPSCWMTWLWIHMEIHE